MECLIKSWEQREHAALTTKTWPRHIPMWECGAGQMLPPSFLHESHIVVVPTSHARVVVHAHVAHSASALAHPHPHGIAHSTHHRPTHHSISHRVQASGILLK